jgi:hypothetical protein
MLQLTHSALITYKHKIIQLNFYSWKNFNSCVYIISNRILTYYLQLTFARSRKAAVRFVMNVRPSVRPSAWNNSTSTGRRSMTTDMSIFRKFVEKFKFH